jgi:hypothetical protein
MEDRAIYSQKERDIRLYFYFEFRCVSYPFKLSTNHISFIGAKPSCVKLGDQYNK